MPCQGDFLAGFTFVDIHDFDIPLSGGDTLVRHDALYGADVRVFGDRFPGNDVVGDDSVSCGNCVFVVERGKVMSYVFLS